MTDDETARAKALKTAGKITKGMCEFESERSILIHRIADALMEHGKAEFERGRQSVLSKIPTENQFLEARLAFKFAGMGLNPMGKMGAIMGFNWLKSILEEKS